MKITQLRNATLVIHYKDQVILVDPMLAAKGAIPSLTYITRNRHRNPLVDLPHQSDEILSKVTHCLITHCRKGHFDHLDRAGSKWLRQNNIKVFCSEQDSDFLRNKGLAVQVLSADQPNDFFDGHIQLIPCLHGRGLVGKLMEHGYGFVITQPNEPSLYLTGDTVLSEKVKACITQQAPDVIVLPAGGARLDLGGEIIMGLDEAIAVAKLTQGKVIANHLEALDHCPVSRDSLRAAACDAGVAERYYVPQDGETLVLECHNAA